MVAQIRVKEIERGTFEIDEEDCFQMRSVKKSNTERHKKTQSAAVDLEQKI